VLPPRYDLAHALLTVGLLVDAVYSFIMRLCARDIDKAEWDYIDPEVTKACFARVLVSAPNGKRDRRLTPARPATPESNIARTKDPGQVDPGRDTLMPANNRSRPVSHTAPTLWHPSIGNTEKSPVQARNSRKGDLGPTIRN
jgi:hypothetical protein